MRDALSNHGGDGVNFLSFAEKQECIESGSMLSIQYIMKGKDLRGVTEDPATTFFCFFVFRREEDTGICPKP